MAPHTDDSRPEPVRRNLYLAAGVVAASTFLGGIGIVEDITGQVVALAGSAALGQFGIIAFGVERARDKVRPL